MFQEGVETKRLKKMRWEFGNNKRSLLRNNTIFYVSEPYRIYGKLKHIITSTTCRSPSWETSSCSASQMLRLLLNPNVYFTVFTRACLWSLFGAARMYSMPASIHFNIILNPASRNARR
jgi:hypothetical protein